MATPQTPSPPFFPIPNISNLRDPTLYPLSTLSGPLRPSLLFRSADVSKLSVSGWKSLRELGVTHVFDLRSKPEIDRTVSGNEVPTEGGNGDVEPEWIGRVSQGGVTRVWTPVFKTEDYSPERLAERYVKYMDEDITGFVEAYKDILNHGGNAFRQILLFLASPNGPQGGALVHCTAGKDRTGIFFGVLFDFLGVRREDIAAEYALTEVGLAGIREEVVGRLMQSPAFKNYMAAQLTGTKLSTAEIAKIIQDEKDGKIVPGVQEEEMKPEVREMGRQAALRMVGSRKESMLGALEMLDREFGGAEKYLRGWCGLGDGELEALRRNLVGGMA